MTPEEQAAWEAGRNYAYRTINEASAARKARCVEKCNHPADFVCDYEDGTSHCLECLAEKWWQVEDILSGKHNVHAYWGALETIAHPERMLSVYDPVEVARTALAQKR
jgi:hypothetical protein